MYSGRNIRQNTELRMEGGTGVTPAAGGQLKWIAGPYELGASRRGGGGSCNAAVQQRGQAGPGAARQRRGQAAAWPGSGVARQHLGLPGRWVFSVVASGGNTLARSTR